MLSSKDGLIRVEQSGNISAASFPPASWSIVNLPTDPAEADSLFRGLYNTAASRHTCLALCRHRRKDRPAATANLARATIQWSYLDTVSIWYERPSACSNNGFLPISEPGYLLYKGDAPDTKKTAWFSSDESQPNATNLWNLATQPGEGTWTYYQKFSWEMNLLLMSMTSPSEHNRFIYGLEPSEGDLELIFKFCVQHQMGVQLYAKTHFDAESIINSYENFSKELTNAK